MILQQILLTSITCHLYKLSLNISFDISFNTLIDNKIFFDQSVERNKKFVKKLLKCQEMMMIQRETY